MKINQQLRFIVVNRLADSLHSIIADGQYRSTSLGRDEWKKLIGSNASLQHNCNKEGFNAFSGRTDRSKVRIGIVSDYATRATLSLDLVREVTLMTQNLVETRQKELQIMDARVSKPWGTYWCNKTTLCCFKSVNHACFTLETSYSDKTVQANGREKSPKYTVTTHLNC